MPLVPDYIPTYIKQQINASPKQVVTAERWNELFNLVITQGDNTTDDVVSLLTALAATTAAANIGADVNSVVGKTVQEILDAFEIAIADRYTKTESNALVATNTNDLVKSITFNDQDGKFTITKKDGTAVVIDTILEKVPVSMVFETVGAVTRIKLTNQDGTTSSADVSSLVDNYTFSNTDTIALSTTGTGNQKNISATLRDGSVTLPKLSLDTVTQLQGYRDAAANSATAASASKDAAAASAAAANTSKTAAAQSATTANSEADRANSFAVTASLAAQTASTHATTATNASNAAEASKNSANTSAVAAQSWATGGTGSRVGEDTNNAKYYAEQAQIVVGEKVATFNGRGGVVVPEAGDYTPEMVGVTSAYIGEKASYELNTAVPSAFDLSVLEPNMYSSEYGPWPVVVNTLSTPAVAVANYETFGAELVMVGYRLPAGNYSVSYTTTLPEDIGSFRAGTYRHSYDDGQEIFTAYGTGSASAEFTLAVETNILFAILNESETDILPAGAAQCSLFSLNGGQLYFMDKQISTLEADTTTIKQIARSVESLSVNIAVEDWADEGGYFVCALDIERMTEDADILVIPEFKEDPVANANHVAAYACISHATHYNDGITFYTFSEKPTYPIDLELILYTSVEDIFKRIIPGF